MLATVVPALVIIIVGTVIALVLNYSDKNADLFDAELGITPYVPPVEMRFGVPDENAPKV